MEHFISLYTSLSFKSTHFSQQIQAITSELSTRKTGTQEGLSSLLEDFVSFCYHSVCFGPPSHVHARVPRVADSRVRKREADVDHAVFPLRVFERLRR